MSSMSSGWAYSGYNSDNGIVYTWEWDFAPAYTVGQVSIRGVAGDGQHITGVISYRYRPDPHGAETTVNLGDANDWKTWQAYVYADQIYDAYYQGWTGEQWIGITKTAPTKLKFGNYSWAGYVGFFGYNFLGNYGFLTTTLPEASKSGKGASKSTIAGLSKAQVKATRQSVLK